MHQVKLFFLIFLVNFAYSSVALPISFNFVTLKTALKDNLILRYDTGGSTTPTTYKITINQWLPAVIVAGILAMSIIAIVYAVGEAFNIDKLKIYASSEIPQVIVTLIFSLLVVSILEFGSSLLMAFEDTILQQRSLQAVCENIAVAHSQLDFNNPSSNTAYGLDAIYGIAYNSAKPSICEVIKDPSGNEPYYFLASSELILLNNTVKLLNFSNSLYILHTVLSFLGKLQNKFTAGPFSISFNLYAGLTTLADVVKDTEKEVIGYISFNFISIMLLLFVYNYWVELLMAGILLRTFSFTRKLGGFLIALVISTVFITPFIYLLVYSTILKIGYAPLSMNPQPSDNFVCGVSSSSSSTSTSASKASLAYRGFCGCFWGPYKMTSFGIIGWEVEDFFLNLLTPIVGAEKIKEVIGAYPCQFDEATAYVTFLASSEFIGKIMVETYLFPIIAFFVTLANILGLSWLFGGTTYLFGLERLVG
jgi:ABC-type multidrug transport system fused ATPase/permease subunit